MLRRIFTDYTLIVLLLLTLFIKIVAAHPAWVEHQYTYGVYPYLSAFLRGLWGWLPFSIGDLLYLFAFLFLGYKAIQLVQVIRKQQLKSRLTLQFFRNVLVTVLSVYVLFYGLWGLNYNRQGIAVQLGLQVKQYSVEDLDTLATTLEERLNATAALIDTSSRMQLSNKTIFTGGKSAYQQVEKTYSFLHYAPSSLKRSMYSSIGHYFGFTGYYNPFSGEAQIKTSVPVFLKPFIITHEIAHQLGYAKENEANFVGFLACKGNTSVHFRYSVYYELFLYAVREIHARDTLSYKVFMQNLHPLVQRDNEELKRYLMSTENPIEPLITAFYDQYLKMNSQPKGLQTYNEVVAWLIAFQKKYGLQAI